jgi:DNA-binding NarL/FixJ family response regulator
VGKLPVVAISDVPADQQGLAALGAGVVGYCNGHAAPAVLRLVADTVRNGGLWVGQSLLQRLLAGIAHAAAAKFIPPELSAWASGLTEREIEVARAAASGLGNKEIASQLDITERTVKARLGSVFDKLKLRDRMHLTLLVNGIVKS